MLSSASRTLTRLSAICYLLLGAVLFLAPNWASGNFPWNVSPFVVMTIGGWCLGNSVFAWQSAHSWEWSRVYPSLTYLWLFGVLEAAVLSAFRDKVSVGSIVALGYMVTIGINSRGSQTAPAKRSFALGFNSIFNRQLTNPDRHKIAGLQREVIARDEACPGHQKHAVRKIKLACEKLDKF